MNPARTFGPDLVSKTFTSYWVYVAGPIARTAIAVVIAFILRGMGGDKAALGAAQGDLFTESFPRPASPSRTDHDYHDLIGMEIAAGAGASSGCPCSPARTEREKSLKLAEPLLVPRLNAARRT